MLKSKKAITRIQVIVIAVVIVVAAVAGAYYYYITRVPTPPVIKEIRIGVLQPLTGWGAYEAGWFKWGMEKAAEWYNARGGILGKYPVKLIVGDAKSDPKVAAAETERLIMKEDIVCIMGCFGSSLSYAATEVAERYKMPFFVMGAIDPRITERGFNYVFRMLPNSKQAGSTSAKFVEEVVAPGLGIPISELRVASVHEDGPFGTSIQEYTIKALEEKGVKLVAHEAYSEKAVDLTPVIMKLKEADPDVLLLTQYGPDEILFFRQAEELDFNVKAWVYVSGPIEQTAFAEAVDPRYVLGTQELLYGWFGVDDVIVQGFPSEMVERAAWAYAEMREEQPVIEPAGIEGFVVADFVFDDVLPRAIEKYGYPPTPESIQKAAVETDYPLWLGYGCRIKFYPPGDPDQGQNMYATYVGLQWLEDRTWVVWPPEVAVREVVLPFPTWEERAKGI